MTGTMAPRASRRLHDVAIQQLPVIFCLDRAGMVGEDGQTHMGLYDIAYLLAVPHMTVTAPKDGAELIGLLRCSASATFLPLKWLTLLSNGSSR